MEKSPDFHLFVYGTLAPGEINEHILQPLNGSWQPAAVRGTLHPEGWGASYGFPSMKLDEDAALIDGKLFSSIHLASQWQQLDEFEGAAYKRVITEVLLQDGETCMANVYVLNEDGANELD